MQFRAFPAGIQRALESTDAPDSERASIVGLAHGAYAGKLDLFDGSTFVVKFAPRPLTTQAPGIKLRMAALVNGQVVDFVSTNLGAPGNPQHESQS